MRTTLNLDQFFLVHWQMKTSSSWRSWDPIRLKIIAVVNEGAKVLDTCTTLMGLPDLASDGSPLFAEPMFLFGCALCNTSTYCMLTLWLSCVNYALLGEFPLLHRLLQDIFTYALFWLPRLWLSLKKHEASQLYYFVFLKRTFAGTKVLMRWICTVNIYNFFLRR